VDPLDRPHRLYSGPRLANSIGTATGTSASAPRRHPSRSSRPAPIAASTRNADSSHRSWYHKVARYFW
jgi:hypothetical protein